MLTAYMWVFPSTYSLSFGTQEPIHVPSFSIFPFSSEDRLPRGLAERRAKGEKERNAPVSANTQASQLFKCQQHSIKRSKNFGTVATELA